jgi:hypothetical protein
LKICYLSTVDLICLAKVELEADQLILEAVHGDGNIGYAAVDQIHRNEDPDIVCETVPIEAAQTTAAPTTETPPASERFPPCNFEEGTCGWFSSADNGLVWRRGTSNEFGADVPHPNGDMAQNPDGETIL